jgi:hypothetical protein
LWLRSRYMGFAIDSVTTMLNMLPYAAQADLDHCTLVSVVTAC